MAKKGGKARLTPKKIKGSWSRKIPVPPRSSVLPLPKMFHAKPACGENKSRGVVANTLPTVGPESVAGLRIADRRPSASVGLEEKSYRKPTFRDKRLVVR